VNNDVDAIRILVVDDERDIREASERILKRIGFIVHTADRGDVALKVFREVHPAIVLLDLKMPGMDGMEVLEHIRQMDETILVIVITGYATVETAITAMKQGAYDFIPKPFEPDQLRIVVNRAAEKIRLTRDARKLEEEKTRTLSDLDTEKSRIRSIIESLPDGVLVTNASGKVVLINPSCKHLLNLDPDMGPGRQIEDYVQDETLSQLVMEISKGKHVDYGDIPDHEFIQVFYPTRGILAFYDRTTGEMELETVVPDTIEQRTLHFATVSGIKPRDTMVVENLRSGERGCGMVDTEGRVRAALASDRGDKLRLSFYSGPVVTGEDCGLKRGVQPRLTVERFQIPVRKLLIMLRIVTQVLETLGSNT